MIIIAESPKELVECNKTDLSGSCDFVRCVSHHTESLKCKDTQLARTNDRLQHTHTHTQHDARHSRSRPTPYYTVPTSRAL